MGGVIVSEFFHTLQTSLATLPWKAMGLSALQTVIIYWGIIYGIKRIGIHAVGQTGPQYTIFLLLLTTAMSAGLSIQSAGFWGSVASGLTLIIGMLILQRIPPVRQWIHGKPVHLMHNGEVDKEAVKKTLVENSDLQKLARQYGLSNLDNIERITLENDGRLTAVLKQPVPYTREH